MVVKKKDGDATVAPPKARFPELNKSTEPRYMIDYTKAFKGTYCFKIIN